MNIGAARMFRLFERGGAGLACDEQGLALGAMALTRERLAEGGARRCEARSPAEIGAVLRAAYGPHPEEVVLRLHRGLARAAAWVEAGDLCRAGIEAVMLGFPDLEPEATAKLASLADLEKAGAAWENEPRVPPGQAGGGQWTTGAAASAATPAGARTVSNIRPLEANRPPQRRAIPAAVLDDGVYRPPTPSSAFPPESLIDDGGYLPAARDPLLVPTGGSVEELEEEPPYRSNKPPPGTIPLLEAFPGLRDKPWLQAPVAAGDELFGIGPAVREFMREYSIGEYKYYYSKIHEIEPSYEAAELYPPGGFEALDQQGQASVIAELRIHLGYLIYRTKGDINELQNGVLDFLQNEVDRLYQDGCWKYDQGQLRSRLSRQEAIGNYIDVNVREHLRTIFNATGVKYGPRLNITINNRENDSLSQPKSYRIPDARVGNKVFEWTLQPKTITSRQVLGFFAADSRPDFVTIVRPRQLGDSEAYSFPRPHDSQLRKALEDMRYSSIHTLENPRYLLNWLGYIMLFKPDFHDIYNLAPEKRMDWVFQVLNDGLLTNREGLGEALYLEMKGMSDQIRALFERQPCTHEDIVQSADIIHEMEEALIKRF